MRNLLTFVAVVFMFPTIAAAGSAPIIFDIPDKLADYTGQQPVTFGVPFERDTLAVSDAVAVVDEKGNPVPAQIEVTSTWTAEGTHVRWLLIDTFADITGGKAAPRFIAWGDGVHGSHPDGPTVDVVGSRIAVGETSINPDGGNVGQFTLVTGDGRVLQPRGNFTAEVERHGPIRTVVKTTADYIDPQGASIAQAVTRYRLYPGLPFMRVYHTFIWQTTDDTTIARLQFDTSQNTAANVAPPSAAGLDGRAVEGDIVELTQTSHDTAIGSAEGKRIDGWAHSGNTFAAVRWPWQQFPMRVGAREGRVSLGLIGSPEPMSLSPAAVAVDLVQPPREYSMWDIQDIVNGSKTVAQLSPRGVAKTWEILVWREDTNLSPQVKNAVLQTPVTATADPAFATRAGVPNLMSPCDPQRFPIIEAGLSRVFDWFTKPLAREGDYGVWNFGDVQWSWTLNGWAIYRYWMNQGKGFSVVPWVLYLRSGERKYLDFAEANARHVMDIDTCHVPEWTYQPDGKRRGAPYSYSAIHWGAGPFLAEFQAESEYLPNCYYITGYERAQDVMLEVTEALATFEYEERWLKDFRESRDKAHRHLYAMVKELGVLYEATWDPRLKVRLDEYFDLTMKAQGEDGNFPNVKTNHYLSQPLNLAVRFFGPDRAVPAIRAWQNFRGDVDRVGKTGAIAGPMSLWTLVTLDQHTDDPHYLDLAGRIARTQAIAVTDGETEWYGFPPMWGPETGPHLRDWVITMGGLARRNAPPNHELLAMPSLHGQLPLSEKDTEAGWTWRHVMLLLDSEENELSLDINGLTKGKCQLRVIDPVGGLMQTIDHDFTDNKDAAASARVTWKTGGHPGAGVYAVELLTQGRFPDAITAHSSHGKLLHLISPKRVALVSEPHVGVLWATPRGGKDVVIGKVQNVWMAGRAVIRDAAGKVLATTQVTRTREQRMNEKSRTAAKWVPDGEPCTLPAAQATPGSLIELVIPVTNVAHLWWSITGIQPYVATTQAQWFDVTQHKHPDLSQLMRMPLD